MALLALAALADAAAWRTRAPDGSTSGALTVADGPRLVATGAATGHVAEATLPEPVDLTGFEDLQLGVRCDRRADGSPEAPFFLELRLGSAALAPGAPGNPWHRLLPVAQPGARELVLLSLADLPDAVRGALTTVRVTCLDATTPFAAELDGIAGLREAMLSDVDAALVARLGGKVEIGDGPVPAVVAVADGALPDPPVLRIVNYEVRAAEERAPQTAMRTDHTAGGFALRPPRETYDLLYEVAAIVEDRAAEAALLEHVLAEIAPRGRLVVDDRPLPVDLEPLPATEGHARPERVLLRFRVQTSQRRPAPLSRAVPPHARVDVEVDQRATA